MKMLEQEVNDPDSTIFHGGEQRVQLVKEIVDNVRATLSSLEKYARKYEISSPRSGSIIQLRQKVKKFKWAIHRKTIDDLRGRIHQHNGILTLLLTSAGNSSLQRVQSTTNTLNENVQAIRDLMIKQQGGKDLLAPSLSVLDDDKLRSSVSAILLRNAEITQPWTTIGVTQWIDTGSWWLQGFELGWERITPGTEEMPVSVYTSLIKASWIMIDIIACHPQVTFVSSTIRAQIDALCISIRGNFERLGNSQLRLPDLHRLCDTDFQIWESHTRAPSWSQSRLSLLDSIVPWDSWVLNGTALTLFGQRGSCRLPTRSHPIVCDIMVITDVQAATSRLLCSDQAHQNVVEIDLYFSISLELGFTYLVLNDCEIRFEHSGDLTLLKSIIETVKTYYENRGDEQRSTQGLVLYCCLIMLKNHQQTLDILVHNIKNMPTTSASTRNILPSLRQATLELYDESTSMGDLLLKPWDQQPADMHLLFWSISMGQAKLVELLLMDGLAFMEDPFTHKDIRHLPPQESRLHLATRLCRTEVAEVLVEDALTRGTLSLELMERGQYLMTALHYACKFGDEKIARLYVGIGVDVNVRTEDYWTPLHFAAYHGLADTVRYLLDSGALMEMRTDMGDTPLLLSLFNKKNVIVDILLGAGANPNVNNKIGLQSIHYALAGNATGIDAGPIPQNLYDNLYARWLEASPSSSQLQGPVEFAKIEFELNSEWGVLFLDSPSLSFSLAGVALPEFVSNRYNRALVVRRPEREDQGSFSVTIEIEIVFRALPLYFAMWHCVSSQADAQNYSRFRIKNLEDAWTHSWEWITQHAAREKEHFVRLRVNHKDQTKYCDGGWEGSAFTVED